VDDSRPSGGNMSLVSTGKNDTTWGYEIIWTSNDLYCGKILVFEKAGSKTNVMLHKERKKSWFVNAGKFRFTFIDVKTGKTNQTIIEEGKTVDIAEMSPHSVEAMTNNASIIEVGMADMISDRFNITPDDNQKSVEEPK
jgi:mannose-6-phosphate isomerase-like protein (cupin superfamily)